MAVRLLSICRRVTHRKQYCINQGHFYETNELNIHNISRLLFDFFLSIPYKVLEGGTCILDDIERSKLKSSNCKPYTSLNVDY